MALQKKTTNMYPRITALSIMSCEVADDGPRVAFMGREKGSSGIATLSRPCTKGAYNTFQNGLGRAHPNLKYGMTKSHLYNFALLLEEQEGKKEPVVIGAHSFPTPAFSSAAMADSLPGEGTNLGLSMEEAVIHVRPNTGEMDIHVIPQRFTPYMVKLIALLEKESELNEDDVFEFNDHRFTIVRFVGNDVIIRCEKTSDYNKLSNMNLS